MASLRSLLCVSLLIAVTSPRGALAECDDVTLNIKQVNGSTDLLIDASFPSTDFAGTVVNVVFSSAPGSRVTAWGVNDVTFTANGVSLDVAGVHKGRFGVLLSKPTTDALEVVSVSSDDESCDTKDAIPPPAWAWEGPTGPAFWEDIGYPDCGPSNMFQSPFNIQDASSSSGSSVVEEREHVESAFTISQSHGVPVYTCAELGSCGSITASGIKYDLLQFHFHSYSEYAVDGEFGILGVHFVHISEEDQLLVLGRIYHTSNATNTGFEKFWTPEAMAAEDNSMSVDINIDADIYADAIGTDLYEFQGSLTTPPCSGNVQWLFIREAGTISHAQMEIYRDHAALTNNRGENRPLQPENGRRIVKTTL